MEPIKDEDAIITIENNKFQFPTFEGSEGEKAIDIRTLRAKTGYIAYDESYADTGSCLSEITFIDGEKGILRYRGYPIEQLAEHSRFLESAFLIIYGELPNAEEFKRFSERARANAAIDTKMKLFFQGYPREGHPMAILSSLLNALACYYPEMASNIRSQDLEHFDEVVLILLSKIRTLAAMTYRMKKDLPFVEPKDHLRYSQNFLHMMFSMPDKDYMPSEAVSKALDLILLLHADHEQNCSTSTVRMVASGGANIFASVAAGICALWGPLHGGANMEVISMLEQINKSGDDGSKYIENAKNGKTKLMGFGHRVYKNYDPRAKILSEACKKVLGEGHNDPLLDIAKHLEKQALEDDYFIKRKLYPNVDFYSGIIMQAIGIPTDMFTVIFAIGRMAGWIANWKEVAEAPDGRIYRPRQIYTGPTLRDYIPLEKRSKKSL